MRGGKRSNAGRPTGAKAKLDNAIAALAASKAADLLSDGETPLMIILRIMNDPETPVELKIKAATAALPYCHRKLPQEIEVTAHFPLPSPVVLVFSPPPELEDDLEAIRT